MANKIFLEIMTPTRNVVNEYVDMVTASGVEGSFGVLANHTPYLTALKIGELRFQKDGETKRLAVSRGFCEISNNKITILAEAAEFAEEIDVERALRAKERAERRLQEAQVAKEKIDVARAQAALARALTRLKVAGKLQ